MKKRVISVLLAGLLCVSMLLPAAFAAQMGDLDGNGKVTTNDARTVLRVAIGLEQLTPEQKRLADADGNGKITTNDARSVLRCAIGLENRPVLDDPAGEEPFDYDAVPDTAESADGKYAVAYVVMPGELKDGSFNESTWNAVKRCAAENKMSYKYYEPEGGEEATPEALKAAVNEAVKNGAKAVVVCSFFFENALLEIAPANPEVEFIYVDGCPLEDDGGKLIPNVLGVGFKAQEAGFLAGYAAVADGCTALGFSGGGGGMNPSVNLYGFGFLQGANAAAKEMNKTVKMNWSYRFGETYGPSDELEAQMKAWFTEDGIEAVMSCGGGMIVSALDAAAAAGGKVIGVDDDLSGEYGELILTSACKNMCGAAYSALCVFFGGRLAEYPDCKFSCGIAEGGVMLPGANWSMKTFTPALYDAFLQRFSEGKYTVSDDLEKLGDGAYRTNVTVKDC